MKALWKGVVLAESDKTIEVEGNHYFPASSVQMSYFLPSKKETICHWKGTASYYDIYAAGEVNRDAAWYYATPSEAAKNIKGYVAFWKGVQVVAS